MCIWNHKIRLSKSATWTNGWGNEDINTQSLNLITDIFAGLNAFWTAITNNYTRFMVNKIVFKFSNFNVSKYYSNQTKPSSKKAHKDGTNVNVRSSEEPDEIKQDVAEFYDTPCLAYYFANNADISGPVKIDADRENMHLKRFKRGMCIRKTIYPRCKKTIKFDKDKFDSLGKWLTEMGAQIDVDHQTFHFGYWPMVNIPKKTDNNAWSQIVISFDINIIIKFTFSGRHASLHF